MVSPGPVLTATSSGKTGVSGEDVDESSVVLTSPSSNRACSELAQLSLSVFAED